MVETLEIEKACLKEDEMRLVTITVIDAGKRKVRSKLLHSQFPTGRFESKDLPNEVLPLLETLARDH